MMVVGCKNRKNKTGALLAPGNADPWEQRYAVAFDNDYTRYKINMTGRAPNDRADQLLFHSRMGHANYVGLVRVEHVYGKGRHQGEQTQYLMVEMGEALMGSLSKDVNDQQQFEVESEDELPGSLRGEVMILFLRWAPGESPPYHHHLMPADADSLSLIKAMVSHAQGEGVLSRSGRENAKGKRKRKRSQRKEKKADKKEAKAQASVGGE
jgi:hypothetical protein